MTSAYKKCIVPQCDHLSNNSVRKFFTLPKNKNDLLRWCENLKIKVPKVHSHNILVCSKHFELEEYGYRSVKSGVVPTLNLGYAPDNSSKIDKKVTRRCCFAHCQNTAKSCTLFSFPSDMKLRNVWCKIADVADKKDLFVCEAHFTPEVVAGKRLAVGANPTENLKSQNLEETRTRCVTRPDESLLEESGTTVLSAVRNERFYQDKIGKLEKKLVALEEEFQDYKAKCRCQGQQTVKNK